MGLSVCRPLEPVITGGLRAVETTIRVTSITITWGSVTKATESATTGGGHNRWVCQFWLLRGWH